jgi:glutaredoxin
MQTEPILVFRRVWCEDSDAAVAYFDQHGLDYREIDIEEDEQAGDGVRFITGGAQVTPTLVYRMQAIVFDPWDAGRFERWWEFANL